jgi:hypothetical protein
MVPDNNKDPQGPGFPSYVTNHGNYDPKATYSLVFTFDWTGTLVSKLTREPAEDAAELLLKLKEMYPNARFRIVSIAADIEPRKMEIAETLDEMGVSDVIDEVLVIHAPKKPVHFKVGDDKTLSVVWGDRPCREIQAGNLAGAFTILVRDPKVSICCDEFRIGDMEDENGDTDSYFGWPDRTFDSLGEGLDWFVLKRKADENEPHRELRRMSSPYGLSNAETSHAAKLAVTPLFPYN